jgi:hypothetical protein
MAVFFEIVLFMLVIATFVTLVKTHQKLSRLVELNIAMAESQVSRNHLDMESLEIQMKRALENEEISET